MSKLSYAFGVGAVVLLGAIAMDHGSKNVKRDQGMTTDPSLIELGIEFTGGSETEEQTRYSDTPEQDSVEVEIPEVY